MPAEIDSNLILEEYINIFKNYSEKSILLSPAAASFDQYENFEDRGKEFKKICKQYARKFI